MNNLARRFIQFLDSKPGTRKRGGRGASGQSLVELALTAPILFMMVIGTAEVGFLANDYLIALDAVREGGRYAVIGNPLTWQKDPTIATGDPNTRIQNLADCETGDGPSAATSATYHINRIERDVARSVVPIPHPALSGYTAGAEVATYGFYDGTACQVISALDPLYFNYNTDDVIISVISYSNRCAEWNPLNVITLAACYSDPDNKQGPIGTRTMEVVGRLPLSNRKCPTDVRDPYNIPGGGPIPVAGTANNDIRGYIMTGNQVVAGCYGSRFYVGDIGDPGEFNLTVRMNTLPDTLLQKNVPTGAMTLVELYWTHGLLFDFPPFSFFKGPTGGIAFQVYMMFPITAAEPTPTAG